MWKKRLYLLRNKGLLNILPGVYFLLQKPFFRIAGVVGIKKAEPVVVPLVGIRCWQASNQRRSAALFSCFLAAAFIHRYLSTVFFIQLIRVPVTACGRVC